MTAHRQDTDLTPWSDTAAAEHAVTLPLAVRLIEAYAQNAGLPAALSDVVGKGDPSGILRSLVDGDVEVRLRASRALTDLAALERTRAVLAAVDDGKSQRHIARLLNVPQTEVHRALRRVRNAAQNWNTEYPRELILSYNAGLTSWGELEGRLAQAATEGQTDPDGIDGYVSGGWDEVRDAYLDGLLTDDEYDSLRAACLPDPSAKRRAEVPPDREVPTPAPDKVRA